MNSSDKEYGVRLVVTDYYAQVQPFDDIKARLVSEAYKTILMPMLNSGSYHVLKLDMGKERNQALCATEYVLVARVSTVRERHVELVTPGELSFDGAMYERICFYCGNALRLDKRGGCSACGAPNGGYK